MKILHVCLAAFYIENYAYQENVLPRMHKNMGLDVSILASCETYIDNQRLGYVEPSSYINKDGIPVTRLPYKRGIPLALARKLRYYEGVLEYLMYSMPDCIFLHDIQFLDIEKIADYKKKNKNVIIFADGHTDYINSARGFISKYVLHGLIYKSVIKRVEKYIEKFYGTLPPRNTFMYEMYDIPIHKLEYLPLGVDDNKIQNLNHFVDKKKITDKYNIDANSYLVVTGGKFDFNKAAILDLVEAVESLNDVSLLIFGSFSEEINKEIRKKFSKRIVYVGWLNEFDSMQIISAADIAVFPYLHSTLWEQTAGIGTPLIVKDIEGFDHLNINDNCRFLKRCDSEEIRKAIEECKDVKLRLLDNANGAKEHFLYRNIAKRVIDEYEVTKNKYEHSCFVS